MKDKIEEKLCEFMGYCSVRYSTDHELAMSNEDIKMYKATAAAILKAIVEDLPEAEDPRGMAYSFNGG